MTFEDDKREVYRKDLIKVLPINVEEDSEDERWGFGAKTSHDVGHHEHHNLPNKNGLVLFAGSLSS